MSAQKVQFSQIVDEFLNLARSHLVLAISTTAAIAVGFVLLDLASQQLTNSFGGFVVGIFVQYAFLERILADRIVSQSHAGGRGYGALFATGFFGNLGIVLGLLLLVVPGIFLLAVWSAANGFVVVERTGGFEGLKASWNATSESRLPICLVYVAFGVAVGLALALAVGGTTLAGFAEDSVGFSVAFNFVTSAIYVAGWLLVAAVYRLVRPDEASVRSIFE